jgi:hypothetical protein
MLDFKHLCSQRVDRTHCRSTATPSRANPRKPATLLLLLLLPNW